MMLENVRALSGANSSSLNCGTFWWRPFSLSFVGDRSASVNREAAGLSLRKAGLRSVMVSERERAVVWETEDVMGSKM